MNPEQQRIAIAEACGRVQRPDGFWFPIGKDYGSAGIPDYLNDLNAMHEAEEILTKIQRMIYVNILWEKCSIAKADPYDWSVSSKPTLRAEAFLHTIGKWKEAK